MELEAVGRGQVPPELVLLAHHQRELAAEGIGPLPGHKTEDPRFAARGIDQPGEHLERRRLARAVGAQEGDHLAGLDREADLIDGADLAVLAVKEPADRPQDALLLLGDAVGLRQFDASTIAIEFTRCTLSRSPSIISFRCDARLLLPAHPNVVVSQRRVKQAASGTFGMWQFRQPWSSG